MHADPAARRLDPRSPGPSSAYPAAAVWPRFPSDGFVNNGGTLTKAEHDLLHRQRYGATDTSSSPGAIEI